MELGRDAWESPTSGAPVVAGLQFVLRGQRCRSKRAAVKLGKQVEDRRSAEGQIDACEALSL